MPEDYVSPLGSLVNWIEGERQRNRQQEDSDLDQKIALIHDMITGPGANPARTADGIRGILELQQAKGGRQKGKRKAGIAGFMGANEEMMPDFLAQLIHKDRPYQGPTFSEQTSEVKQPATVGRLPGQMDQQPQFSGQSVLSEPVMVPPPPLDAAPTGGRMLDAARQMQTQPQGQVALPGAMGMQTTKTQLPDAQQPFMRSPEEMAQLEGNAAGIKENAIYDARNQAKIAMWKRAGLSDDEIRQMLLREARGTTGQPQDADAGYYVVNGQTRRAVRVFNPTTGQFSTVDALTGMPIPPDSAVGAAPSATGATANLDIQTVNARIAAEEELIGRPLTPAEKNKIITAFQNEDANRRERVAAAGAPRNASGFTAPQALTAAGQIQNRYEKARESLTAIEQNVTMMNSSLGALEQATATTGGKVAPAHIAIIYGFNHAVEPTSVVREGEFDRATKGQAWYDRVRGLADRMAQGGVGLTIEEVREYVSLANEIMKGAQQRMREQSLGSFAAQAQKAGVGLDEVFRTDDLNYWNQRNQVPSPPPFNQSTIAPAASHKRTLNSYRKQ